MARATNNDNTDELFPYGRKPTGGMTAGKLEHGVAGKDMGGGLKLPQRSKATLVDRLGSPTITGKLKMARTKGG